jgi:hypothetical protein
MLSKKGLNVLSVIVFVSIVFITIRYVERRQREKALQNVGTDTNRIAIAFRTLLYPFGDALGTNIGQNVDEGAIIELGKQTGKKFPEVQKFIIPSTKTIFYKRFTMPSMPKKERNLKKR